MKELEHIELPDFFTHSLIRSYHGYLISSTNADKTIIRRLATLRKFFQFCIEQRWLTSNPANDFANRNKQDEREELVIEYAKTLKARGKSDIDLARHINVVRDFITSS